MPDKSFFKNHEEYLTLYKQYRTSKILKLRKYNREYNKQWRKKNNYSDVLRYEKKYPEKRLARLFVLSALNSGKLKKLPCIVCGSLKSQAHHEDYSKPLEVIWLCALHHKRLHQEKDIHKL